MSLLAQVCDLSHFFNYYIAYSVCNGMAYQYAPAGDF